MVDFGVEAALSYAAPLERDSTRCEQALTLVGPARRGPEVQGIRPAGFGKRD